MIKKIFPYILMIALVILIRTYVITPAIVNGDSMNDTLIDGEVVLENKIVLKLGKINRYDIVVVDFYDELLIKRVIGLPNETIEYKDNILYINGIKKVPNITFELTEDFIYETQDEEYFVLGDNRDISKDSRYFGGIKKEQILGKVNIVLYPFNRFGILE